MSVGTSHSFMQWGFKSTNYKDNIDQFKIQDQRTENIDFINDRKALEKKLENYEKGVQDELTLNILKVWLTVLTYNQYMDKYWIVDGVTELKRWKNVRRRKSNRIWFWLIPATTSGY